MAEKELGYVELEWTCPNCNTRNPGSAPKCKQCGAAMPANVKFEQAAEEALITDEAKIAAAKAGPDIYCAYCGTRNVSTAEVCRQCGAALTEGTARETQGVVGALRDKPAPPQKCPNCGTENKASALKCVNCGAPMGKAIPAQAPVVAPAARPAGIGIIALILVGVVVVVGAFILLGRRSSDTVAQVADFGWRRAIAVQQLAPVTREGWLDQLPAGVDIAGCRKEVLQTVSEPVPGAREVCGTPYVVDTGTGLGRVKQDCEYEVLADYCQYRSMEWVVGPPIILEGSDLNPRWPAANLGSDQRPGGQTEEYFIVFRAADRDYTYTTRSVQEYLELAQGARWKLTINGFGQITNIEPA
jgi:ribosomal protein L40E